MGPRAGAYILQCAVLKDQAHLDPMPVFVCDLMHSFDCRSDSVHIDGVVEGHLFHLGHFAWMPSPAGSPAALPCYSCTMMEVRC
jgi:hypothetical protein